MPQPAADNPPIRRPFALIRVLVWSATLALLGIAGIALVSDDAAGAGTLVIIEDASTMGGGTFSGNVCYDVIRDSDGEVMTGGCTSVPVSIAAPDWLEIGPLYSISVTLGDANCLFFPDVVSSDGSYPFVIRVSCDPTFMTATANAQPTATATPPATETPTPEPTPTIEPTSTPTAIPTPTIEPTNTPTGEPPVETVEPAPPTVESDEATESDSGESAQQYEIVPAGGDVAPVSASISHLTLEPATVSGDSTGTLVVDFLTEDLSGGETTVALTADPGTAIQVIGMQQPEGAECDARGPLALPIALTAPLPLAACGSETGASTDSFEQSVSLGISETPTGRTGTLIVTLAYGPGPSAVTNP